MKYRSLIADGQLIEGEDTWDDSGLSISGSESKNRTSAEYPVIKLSVNDVGVIYSSDLNEIEITDLTEAERMSFFTGKMTVMPFLAGWTVKYHTVNGGDQEYTIPSDIPEDGLEIQIPIAEGDYLDKPVVLMKKGTVDGWIPKTRLLKHLEFKLWRTLPSGKALFSDDEGKKDYNLYDIEMGAYISFSDCTGGDYSGVERSHLGEPDETYSVVDGNKYRNSSGALTIRLVGNVAYDVHNPATTEKKMGDILQGTEEVLNIKVNLNQDWNWEADKYDKSYIRNILSEYLGYVVSISGYPTAYNLAEYGWKPTFYVEMTSEDLVYLGGEAKVTFGANLTGSDPNDAASYTPVESSADVEYIQTENGKLWLKVTPHDTADWFLSSGQKSNGDRLAAYKLSLPLYALPGAALGEQQVIGDVYLDIGVDELLKRNTDGSLPKYVEYRFKNTVADENGLLGDGDTTTPRLYKISGGTSTNVLQKIFSGVSLIPGSETGGMAVETRQVDIYNHDADKLKALITVGAANEDLKDYEVVVELPKKGKQVTGTQVGEGVAQVTVESQADMRLTKEPEVASNSTSSEPEFSYRLVGSSEWITAEQVTDWGQVDAIKMKLEKMLAQSVLNVNLSMSMDKQTEEGISSYIGGSYSYVSQNGLKSEGVTMLGQYTFHLYELSGQVWYDRDENGTLNSPYAEGIKVHLKREADGSIVDTQITGASGKYKFVMNEGEGLYAEVEAPEGYKLTKESGNMDFTASGTDSDFKRETNRVDLPDPLVKGSYGNLGAGLVKLPVVTAPDITVPIGDTAEPKASAQWEKGTPTLHYEQAADTGTATVREDGKVTGVKIGSTTAKVWVENSLGDRVEAEYTITVLPQPVSFTLTKELTEAAGEDETFVFEISGEGKTFYQTVTVAAGSTSGSVKVRNLAPGSYTVKEIESNWRYENTGSGSRTQELTDHEGNYTFTFTNRKDTDEWVSGKAKVTNTMA